MDLNIEEDLKIEEEEANDETAAKHGFNQYNQKPRWVMPQTLDRMTYVGRHMVAVAHDIFIVFINTKTLIQDVYVADDHAKGDGVDVIAGHRTSVFAFSEKVNQGRIIVAQHPSFKIISELKDMDVNRYKGLCMMDCDIIGAISGFPNYIITIWNWRTKRKLISLPTGVVRRSKDFMPSHIGMLICECWGEGLHVWEVAQCYKKCLIIKRTKEEKTGWEMSDPSLEAVCWSSEGQLYALDPQAVLYNVCSDGVRMMTKVEWDTELTGPNKVCMCALPSALLIFGPDDNLRLLKRTEHSWYTEWLHKPLDTVVKLINNVHCDEAVAWTRRGQVYKITHEAGQTEMVLVAYKPRNLVKIQMLAPEYDTVALLDKDGDISVFELESGKLMTIQKVDAQDVIFEASPAEPLLAVVGLVSSDNYALALVTFCREEGLKKVASMCLTVQIVDHIVISPSGREMIVSAMSAGHIFIFKVSTEYTLTLVRYVETGRGFADCFLMSVGDTMRAFSLMLFSDKYFIGERVTCITVETGKDNKFAGKMQGPYMRMLPTAAKDTIMAIPHLSRQFQILKLSGDKGVSIQVRVIATVDTDHIMRHFDACLNASAILSYGYGGLLIIRAPDAPELCVHKMTASHRYANGVRCAQVSADRTRIVWLNNSGAATFARLRRHLPDTPTFEIEESQLTSGETITIVGPDEKNYLDIIEEKKVWEEEHQSRALKAEVLRLFAIVQVQLVEMLEENLAAPQLHQLSLSEFNLHQEARRDRLKQAEKEREDIRQDTEARIKAQEQVTAWIKRNCWDTMLTPRVKILAIFSHYQVENYPILPSQRDTWPELQQIEALRAIEKENAGDLFYPWDESKDVDAVLNPETPAIATKGPPQKKLLESIASLREFSHQVIGGGDSDSEEEQGPKGDPYVLSGSMLHKFVPVPEYAIPQTFAYTFKHMHWLQEINKLNTQNMRMWFNKQFDELMTVKKREVALVEERNSRLRFIVEELNKLSNLRGSFHHLIVAINDPQWAQEEQPHRLIKVDPEECSIEPYVSPSQIVIIPPDPGPKDDFRERALMEMMDGVLEKLWHEEIKKPIPPPQCMLDKDPEHFNEEDLRQVFEYEAKVAFRNEERDKYRKMLHAEYAKLSQILNEGVVKFNNRVKELWLLRLKVDSVIGQENLNLMRLRRVNLDRVEKAEELEGIRKMIEKYEAEIHHLTGELEIIQKQSEDCQAMYDALTQKDKQLERMFKTPFSDQSPMVYDQCLKFYKKRPKWYHRATMTPNVLYEMAMAVATGHKPPLLHPDCNDYLKSLEQMEHISNMPSVLEEVLWVTVMRLRRHKIENEIKMRAMAQEMAYVDNSFQTWTKAIAARRELVARCHHAILELRAQVELAARNRTVQIVLPAGQVEIVTTGHFEDFDDASLILRDDVEAINNLILKVGELKLRMMRRQMEFRKGILSKEWEHAQMKMKLRHMQEELYTYQRLKIPKELQYYLKNVEKGVSDEQNYVKMEKEMEASKAAINKVLNELIQRYEELQVKLNKMQVKGKKLEEFITHLNVKMSEKKHFEDPLEPIRRRRNLKWRMEIVVERSKLIRDVQANQTTIVMLQTELELARLRTYPTLAKFKTLDS